MEGYSLINRDGFKLDFFLKYFVNLNKNSHFPKTYRVIIIKYSLINKVKSFKSQSRIEA